MRGIDLVIGFLFLVSGSAASLGLGGLDGGDPVAEGLEPFEGHAQLKNASYTGNARIDAMEGVFAIEGDLHLKWLLEEATIRHHTFRRTGGYVGYGYNLTVAVEESDPPVVERYGNASLTIDSGPSGKVYLWTDNALGGASLRMFLDSQQEVPIAGSAFGVTFGSEDKEYQYWLPGPVFGFGHEDSQYRQSSALPVTFDRFEAEGAVNVLIQSSQIELRHKEGTDTYETGHERGYMDGVVPAEQVSYALVQIPAANVSVEDFQGKWSTFFAPEAGLTLGGIVSFIGIDGEIDGKDVQTPLDGDEVQMHGNSTLELAVEGMSDGTEHSDGSWGVRPEFLPDPDVFATFEGDSEGLLVNGRPFERSEPASVPNEPLLQDKLTFWGRILGAVVLAWAVAWRFVVPVLVGLYNGDPLKNPRRRKILTYLRRMGVAHVREVHRETQIAVGSVVYHLEVLRRSGLVMSARWGNYQAYFPRRPGLAREDLQQLALLADDTRRRIARLVVHSGGVTQEELGKELGMTQSAVSRQLCKMTSAGLLQREKNHRYWYSASDLLQSWFRQTP